ncbi:OmpA/MotB family protein [Pelovirga terrestris]|uniref:OmpA family protein n=1 Tax=Pelovirga terrestris TaxID=2771352 RepID=A0A8J6QQN3_9BACT|nr:flagellar motor protein MotB [Pelovirga terrestris]MBD1401366.1 OmpA family protein [Pelovirga terrestris]
MKPYTFLLLASLLLSTVGCVSKNSYQQKVNETELLTADVATLSTTTTELRQEKQILQADLATLNSRLVEVLQENSQLQRELLVATATKERQEGNLSLHQQRIDALQNKNQELQATVEALNIALDKERVAREARLAQIKHTYEELVEALEEEITRGELTISNLEGKLTVNLLNQILFDSGATQLREEGKKVLKNLGDVLHRFPDRALQIAGHTDNVQISSRLAERFPTNWELSTARATSVIHFLQQEADIPGNRLIAAGFSEYQPVADNSTPQGRAQNRRIEILLVPFASELGE